MTPKLYIAPSSIPEYQRVSFSPLRLSAHSLAIETGRWSRIPRESRVYSCGEGVQTEAHVLAECEKTEHSRRASELSSFTIPELFSQCDNYVCEYVFYSVQEFK